MKLSIVDKVVLVIIGLAIIALANEAATGINQLILSMVV